MAYDEKLASRILAALPTAGADPEDTRSRKMFGGIAFMVHGHMVAAVLGDDLLARIGPEAVRCALREDHVRPAQMGDRVMRGLVFVEPAGLRGAALGRWLSMGVEFTATLPPKGDLTRSS